MSVPERALAWVFQAEGRPTDDPDDPGRATVYGISQRFNPDVHWPPSREDARNFYGRLWARIGCDRLPPKLGFALFDTAVNQGAAWAIKTLQLALGVDQDGVVGPLTTEAAERALQPEVLDNFLARRANYYSLSLPKFRLGLMSRLFRLQRVILAL